MFGTRLLAGTSGPGLSKIFHFLQISIPAIAITKKTNALPINGNSVFIVHIIVDFDCNTSDVNYTGLRHYIFLVPNP